MKFRAAAAALAALFALSCGGVTSPSQNKQDTFSGTLQANQYVYYKVSVSNGGEFSVKITQIQPTATQVFGIAWYLGDNCDILQQSAYATLNTPALAGAILQKDTYCVELLDPSLLGGGFAPLATDQTFTLVVSHP